MISDGDVGACIEAALPEREVDVYMGIGGTPEGVLAAAALRCIGGGIQCQAWPRNDEERAMAKEKNIDLNQVYTTEDMVGGEDVFFAATGVSSGELLKGVRYFSSGAQTQSLVMRARSGTTRWIDTIHNFRVLNKIGHSS